MTFFFAQIPGADQVVNTAAQTGRWEAVALAVIMLIIAGLLAWLVKAWISQSSSREMEAAKAAVERDKQAVDREKRLGDRIDNLEDYIRNTQQETIRECTQALLQNSISQGENTRVLAGLMESLGTTRTCFATGQKQTELVDAIAERIARKVEINCKPHMGT